MDESTSAQPTAPAQSVYTEPAPAPSQQPDVMRGRLESAIAKLTGEQPAEPTAPADAQGETSPEVKKDEPKKEPKSAAFEALERRKAAAKRELEAQKAELDARESRLRSEYSRLEQARQFEELLAKDPLRALELRGIKFDDLTQRALQAGTPDEKLTEVQRALQAEREAREQLANDLRSREVAVARRQAETEFISLVRNSDQFAVLSALDEASLIEAAHQRADQIHAERSRSRNPITSQKELLEAVAHSLESDYSEFHSKIAEALARRKGTGTKAPEGARATPTRKPEGQKPTESINDIDPGTRSLNPRELRFRKALGKLL